MPSSRLNTFDDDFDAVLEAQRKEDERKSGDQELPLKRKREGLVLSDENHRLRKERTENLFEGYRHWREQSATNLGRSQSQLDNVKREEPSEVIFTDPFYSGDDKEDQLVSEDEPEPLPDDFDPPPPSFHGKGDDDPDNGDESAIAGVGQTLAAFHVDEDFEANKGKTTRIVMPVRQIRRVMAARESLFKFGVFVPRSEREAESSPEAPRWKAGKDLEWLRLREQGTFERDWTWERIRHEHATYKKSDIGFLFYVFDYKFSGEHRVRLVFDGSRQSAETYDETYAPTARQESVRMFHVVCVEEAFGIGQYDVPQAFLKAFIDFDIFVYPPRGQAEFEGQILKLRRALYGGKQSAYLWYQMMNDFIIELGFVASTLDKCLYRRKDAILILFCDDLRIGASDPALTELHKAFFDKFGITTASGSRFLGMDTCYQREKGVLKLSMESYISNTMERFQGFDTSRGYPYREIVGCLLWISLCVMGPELLRVKDLARRSNEYTGSDYRAALRVLKRVYTRKEYGIVITRGGAGQELIPSSSRPTLFSDGVKGAGPDDIGNPIGEDHNELLHKLLLLAQGFVAPGEYSIPSQRTLAGFCCP